GDVAGLVAESGLDAAFVRALRFGEVLQRILYRKWAEHEPIANDAFLQRPPVYRLGLGAIAACPQAGDDALGEAMPLERRSSVGPTAGSIATPAIGGISQSRRGQGKQNQRSCQTNHRKTSNKQR